MTTRRTLVVLWLAAGLALWLGVFDLYIRIGVREYLMLRAEFELGLRPEPTMAGVMALAKARGALAASIWTAGILGCAWISVRLAARRRDTQNMETHNSNPGTRPQRLDLKTEATDEAEAEH